MKVTHAITAVVLRLAGLWILFGLIWSMVKLANVLRLSFFENFRFDFYHVTLVIPFLLQLGIGVALVGLASHLAKWFLPPGDSDPGPPITVESLSGLAVVVVGLVYLAAAMQSAGYYVWMSVFDASMYAQQRGLTVFRASSQLIISATLLAGSRRIAAWLVRLSSR